MRLMSKVTAIVLIAGALLGVISGQAQAAGNGGCRMSKSYTNRVLELQQLLGVEESGTLDSKTCGEVLKLHDVLIESGTIPASQRGLIGPTTFRVLQNPDEAPTDQPVKATSPTDASGETKCRPRDNKAVYVICLDTQGRVGSVRSASNGVIGPKVLGPFELTASLKITFVGDTKTRLGQFDVTWYDDRTPEKKLKNFFLLSGEQGIHFYHEVGSKYDSSGCVRVTESTSNAMTDLLTKDGKIIPNVDAHVW